MCIYGIDFCICAYKWKRWKVLNFLQCNMSIECTVHTFIRAHISYLFQNNGTYNFCYGCTHVMYG